MLLCVDGGGGVVLKAIAALGVLGGALDLHLLQGRGCNFGLDVAEGGGGCRELLPLGVRFLLANPHHMT